MQTPASKSAPDRLTLMQTFIRIVEAGSLSAAAAQMSTTQPTISRRLLALERSLGLKLVHRSTHAMKLTEAGTRYYARARELLVAWSEFEADLRGAVDEPQGTLRVVVPHAFGQHQLVGPLAEFLARYPKVAVEWLLHDTPPDFIGEGVDCAIQVGSVPDPSSVAIQIAEVPRIVVAAPALLQNQKTPRKPEALAALPWIALGPYYRKEVMLHNARREEHVLTIAPRIITDSVYALRSAAVRGVGVAAISAWIVADDLASGALVQLVPDWQAPALPVHLIYPFAPFYPAKLRSFVEVIRSSSDTLPWRGNVKRMI
ncbi:LysR family transcriptional regulator [Uliginosibacterium sp. H3]|uniref:LysR family transcriptional regulator n=1 Tax=Uliginosibacterium silvisoli TaxID=3114758 RepID=A0ABU6JXT6_9RHOO|nr:LysR family transcriptional regulator [Uliginosibacterium sp. H3]